MKIAILFFAILSIGFSASGSELSATHANAIAQLLNRQTDGSLAHYMPSSPVNEEAAPFLVKVSVLRFTALPKRPFAKLEIAKDLLGMKDERPYQILMIGPKSEDQFVWAEKFYVKQGDKFVNIVDLTAVSSEDKQAHLLSGCYEIKEFAGKLFPHYVCNSRIPRILQD